MLDSFTKIRLETSGLIKTGLIHQQLYIKEKLTHIYIYINEVHLSKYSEKLCNKVNVIDAKYSNHSGQDSRKFKICTISLSLI
jgi:hypothetical protein